MGGVSCEGSSHILDRADNAVLHILDGALSFDLLKPDTVFGSTFLASRLTVDKPIQALTTTVQGGWGSGNEPLFGSHRRSWMKLWG